MDHCLGTLVHDHRHPQNETVFALVAALVSLLECADPGIRHEIAEVPQLVLVALDVQLFEEGACVWLESAV